MVLCIRISLKTPCPQEEGSEMKSTRPIDKVISLPDETQQQTSATYLSDYRDR